MRRAVLVVVAVVVVVLAGARVSAQGLPHKAYLPRVDNIRPTPTRTVDHVGTSVAGTLTAIAPTRTPLPTATPPGPKCNDIMVNGGFEADGGWRSSSTKALRTRSTVGMTPFEGLWALEIHPFEAENALVVSDEMSAPSLASIESVTLAYQLQGHSLDRVANSDGFLATINVPLGAAGSDPQVVEAQFNQAIDRNWRGRSFDVLPILRAKGWQRFSVSYFVSNDISDNSWWIVDAVTLSVCQRAQVTHGQVVRVPDAVDHSPLIVNRLGDMAREFDRLAH